MKALFSSCKMFFSQITRDFMLLAVCSAPILLGLLFFFGVPLAERLAGGYLEKGLSFAPYYGLMDSFLASAAPFMLCFASAMIILEEIDSGLLPSFFVAPAGRYGYLISRLGIPSLLSAVYSVIIFSVFSYRTFNAAQTALLLTAEAIQGVCFSLLIVSFSSNKVEGMAVAKLGGLFMSGLLVPFFVSGKMQYLAAFLPSFWTAKLLLGFSFFNLLGFGICTGLWFRILYGKFVKKIV